MKWLKIEIMNKKETFYNKIQNGKLYEDLEVCGLCKKTLDRKKDILS